MIKLVYVSTHDVKMVQFVKKEGTIDSIVKYGSDMGLKLLSASDIDVELDLYMEEAIGLAKSNLSSRQLVHLRKLNAKLDTSDVDVQYIANIVLREIFLFTECNKFSHSQSTELQKVQMDLMDVRHELETMTESKDAEIAKLSLLLEEFNDNK